jgi:hypothetical protein
MGCSDAYAKATVHQTFRFQHDVVASSRALFKLLLLLLLVFGILRIVETSVLPGMIYF